MSTQQLLSKIPFERKYNEDIIIARKMTPQQKLDLIIQLHSVGLELIEAKDKEKKLEWYKKENELRKQRLKNFIKSQLERITKE